MNYRSPGLDHDLRLSNIMLGKQLFYQNRKIHSSQMASFSAKMMNNTFCIWTYWKNTPGYSSVMSGETKKTSKQISFSSFPSHTTLNLVPRLWSATNCFLPVVISYCAAHMNSFKGPVGDCGNWQGVTDTADFFVCFGAFDRN